jgi:phytoene dehydrogenase-like protein
VPASLDAIVVGSGPNGLAAAIALAKAGRSVRVYEAEATVGGAVRSAELTEPGFVHDTCSTVHALALVSPFLKSLPLAAHGLSFAHPEAPVAHPLDDGTAVVVRRSLDETADSLGADGRAYRRLFRPFVDRSDDLMEALLAPPRLRHPLLLARFGRSAIRSASGLARSCFSNERTRAMFAGVAAHSMVPLDKAATAGYGLGLLTAAHAVGWPVARGGSGELSRALAAYLVSLGGENVAGTRVEALGGLPPARVVLCDVTPRQFLALAGNAANPRYRRRLARYRYGPGVFKMDWALSRPVPWKAHDCATAGTIHIGGSEPEIAHGEHESWNGRHADRPYAIVVQPTLFDPTRAPRGMHTLWAYCHVPNGSTVDMRARIEQQIERFAPGFRERVIAASVMRPADIERHNANLVGGDIGAGITDLRQFVARPTLTTYSTPVRGLYLCSASTPPGVGVHGMCGYHAAHRALDEVFRD